MSGEVIAASTASRLPARMRSASVSCANAGATAPNDSKPIAAKVPSLTPFALPRRRALAQASALARAGRFHLNNVASEIRVMGPVAFADVIQESVRVLELTVHF